MTQTQDISFAILIGNSDNEVTQQDISFAILIGNSDNKLTQQEWATFCKELKALTLTGKAEIHFEGSTNPDSCYQRFCLVGVIGILQLIEVKIGLCNLAERYFQDSIAVIEGHAEFITP